MLNRTLALGLGLLFAAGLTVLCAQPYERTVRDTVDLAAGSVSVENEEGSVTVSTWARDEVAYRARIVDEQIEEAVQQTRIEVDRADEALSLTTHYDEVEGQWTFGPKSFGYVKTTPKVHYTLRVPASASLHLTDHESDVDVSGLAGPLTIDTHEGTVRVSDHSGRAEISSHEGRMVLRKISGNLIVDTHEGTVTIEDLRGRLDLEMQEGRADVRIDALKEIVADTHEGTIALSLPSSVGFDLSTDLGDDAELESDVDLTSVRRDDTDYQGAVRGGGPLIRLTSHEGRITLSQ